jgi:hypothetical protein
MNYTVDTLRESVNTRMRKNLNNRGVDPKRFNDVLLLAFIREIRFLSGLPESYIPGQSAPAVGLDASQRISEFMEPLLKNAFPPNDIVVQSGVIDISKMMMITSINSVSYKEAGGFEYRPIDYLMSSEIGHRLSHPNKAPSMDFPVCYNFGSKLLAIEPKVPRVALMYYKVPEVPFRDYTISVQDEEIYLPEDGLHDGSVLPVGTPSRTQQVELDFRAMESIENRIYEFVSVRSNDQLSMQAAQLRKQMGQ